MSDVNSEWEKFRGTVPEITDPNQIPPSNLQIGPGGLLVNNTSPSELREMNMEFYREADG